MRRLLAVMLLTLLVVGAAFAGPELEFSFTGISNSDVKNLSASYEDFACQVTERAGFGNVVVELYGSIKPDISNDLSWVMLANSTVVNTTAAGTDNSSWHFQTQDFYATAIRAKALIGADIVNTGTVVCRPGGR